MIGECGRCKTMIENHFRFNWNLLYVKNDKICRIENKRNEEFHIFYLCNRTLFCCFQKDIIIPHKTHKHPKKNHKHTEQFNMSYRSYQWRWLKTFTSDKIIIWNCIIKFHRRYNTTIATRRSKQKPVQRIFVIGLLVFVVSHESIFSM